MGGFGLRVAINVSLAAILVCMLSDHRLAAEESTTIEGVDEVIGDAPHQATAHEYDLRRLVDLGQENEPGLRAALNAVEAARGRARQAGLRPNPTIAFETPQLAGRDSQYLTMLSQEIVTAGKLRLDRAAACREVRQAELAFVRRRFDLLTKIRSGFYSTLAAHRRVEIFEKLVGLLSQSQETATRRFDGGEGSKTDVLLLDVELERAKVGRENARTRFVALREQLAATLGLPDLDIPRVSGDLEAEAADFEFEAIRRDTVAQNSRLQSARVEIQRRQILLRRALAEPVPNITIGAGYQYSVTPLNNQAVIGIALPIPTWNRNQGGIRAARAEVGRSIESLGQLENDLVGRLALALGQYRVARRSVDRYRTSIVPKAEESQRLTQQAYTQGQFDFLRLLRAQQLLVRVDLEYVEAQSARWKAAATIAGLLQVEQFP